MSSQKNAIPKGSIRFKSWRSAQREILTAIREIATEKLVHNTYPSHIHMEGYPGAGITTGVFRATWKDVEELTYRVRIYLDRDATARAEVL